MSAKGQEPVGVSVDFSNLFLLRQIQAPEASLPRERDEDQREAVWARWSPGLGRPSAVCLFQAPGGQHAARGGRLPLPADAPG